MNLQIIYPNILVIGVIMAIVALIRRGKKPKITKDTNSSYEDWKRRFPEPTKKEFPESINETEKEDIRLKSLTKPKVPKPKVKTIQEQIDEAYEEEKRKVYGKPGIEPEKLKVKFDDTWKKPQDILPTIDTPNIGIDWAKDIPDNNPTGTIEFGGGNFGGAGASGSWDDNSTSSDSSSDSSSSDSNND